MSERIGDRDIKPARAATAGAILPDDEHWTVVLDEHGRPAGAIAPHGAAIAEDLVIADAAVPIGDALDSEALRRADGDTVVVVTTGASVVGVWSGEDLVDALMSGSPRAPSESFPSDIQLPGHPRKKDITRRCRHTDHGIGCATILVVPEKPEEMPQCPPQTGVGSHTFEW